MYPKWINASPTNLLPTGSILRRFHFWQYSRLVRSTYRVNLVRCWPLMDTSGTVAADLSNNRGNGTYTSGVTLGQTGVGDGHQAVLCNGTDSQISIGSASLVAALDDVEGTIAAWCKIPSAGVWSDGAFRWLVEIGNGAGEYIVMGRSSTANQLYWRHSGNGVHRIANLGAYDDLDWMHLALTWSATAGSTIAYKDGAAVSTMAAPNAFAGAFNATYCNLARSFNVVTFWSGYLAHAAIWNVALPAQTIARLYRG